MKKMLLAVCTMLLGALALGPASSLAATTTLETTPSNTQGWVNLDTRPGGSYQFVDGPGTPPIPTGSLNLVTTTSTAKASLANAGPAGTALADVDAMSYSTYRSSSSTGSPLQVPSYQLGVDTNGDAAGGFTTLVFEPVYNTGQGAIVNDQWQTWDAFSGGQAIWWSSRDINGQCAFSCYLTWDQIVANNPDAEILYLSINQGSGNPGINANVDAFEFGANGDSTIWDFELLTGPPTTKDQCKNGGWQTFDAPRKFKNQGDCVSFVANGK